MGLTHIGVTNLAQAVSDFHREDITYIHYAKPIYHAMAAQLASRIASRWTPVPATGEIGPTALAALKQASGDIILTWGGVVSSWRVVNSNVLTNAVLYDGVITSPTWTFTLAEQEAAYGYGASSINTRIYARLNGANIAHADFIGAVPTAGA